MKWLLSCFFGKHKPVFEKKVIKINIATDFCATLSCVWGIFQWKHLGWFIYTGVANMFLLWPQSLSGLFPLPSCHMSTSSLTEANRRQRLLLKSILPPLWLKVSNKRGLAASPRWRSGREWRLIGPELSAGVIVSQNSFQPSSHFTSPGGGGCRGGRRGMGLLEGQASRSVDNNHCTED